MRTSPRAPPSKRCLRAQGRSARQARDCAATVFSALQQVDYSFYQALAAEEITDAYLWRRLEPLLGYLPAEQRTKVQEALYLAYDSHSGQVRKSGEPYITHPVEVTRILAELKMDAESLVAGLLHDTVEDTQAVSFEEIEMWFGTAVRRIVEGETKFSKIVAISGGTSRAEAAALDLQQLFLAMTEELCLAVREEVRIIVVKLADRLHNMRTLESMPPHKQKKIADETLLVFAPLARLLGLYSLKEELEALAFRYADPDGHAEVQRRLDALAAQQGGVVLQAQRALQDKLADDSYLASRAAHVTVEAHQKAVYSVYRKLQERGQKVEDVADVAQLRVVVAPQPGEDRALFGTGPQLCYHVMGLVHTIWTPIPGAVKDYIATPKWNGYQSLHTTVLPIGSDDLFPLEVQIRTQDMHRLAEYGIAGENWVSAGKAAEREIAAAMAVPRRASQGVTGFMQKLMSMRGMSNGLSSAVPALSAQANGLLLAPQPDAYRGSEPACPRPSVNGFRANGHAVPSSVRYSTLKLDPQTMARRINWLNSIRDWQAEFVGTLTAREFVACVTDDLLGHGVFAFTPSGEIMRLPKGSTVVDFAYHVHTDVGNQMVGVKVNGKLVEPSHALANAEVVEVLTYPGPPTSLTVQRHQAWVKYAQTKTARHKLVKFLREHADLLPAPATAPVQAPRAAERSSAAQGVGAAPGEPELPAGQVTWLVVQCCDRPGLLADIALAISDHGHNIKMYRGGADPKAQRGGFQMVYQLEGCPARTAALCATIGGTPDVHAWSLYCDWPGDAA
ncbi:hypothetical protein WJX81_002744 [Elliptochloris bilobata]|uniref:Putative GTP diphosphokinase RSH1, chloroplastic n=1 Tax=Elliptochloris bilobata TaxID=381761 RepID=A0AAW1RRE8_9CHLO